MKYAPQPVHRALKCPAQSDSNLIDQTDWANRIGFVILLLVMLLSLAACQTIKVINTPPTPTAAPLHIDLTGLVETPLTLTEANIGEFPPYERASKMICPDGTYDTEEATWQGILLADLFKAARLQPNARKFVVYSDFDDYRQTFKLSELEQIDIFLSLSKDNRPMTFPEGGPARIVAHEEWGYRWVRWVSRIEVTE